ncbi:MAG: hypothetical protein WDO24_26245 [Pseudomonadota bacterium]
MAESDELATLIALEARLLHRRPVTPARAAELAVEVGRINQRVADEAQRNHGFFDDPFQFLAVLESLKDPARG